MIKKYHASKGDDVEVMIIPDIESVNYGRGYEINEFIPPSDIERISATEVRNSIKSVDISWKEMIDQSIQEDVEKYLLGK